MPQQLCDLSDPFFVLSATALFLLSAWPKITFKTERQKCRGVQVTDIAITISRGGNKPSAERSIYIVWKKRKK